MADPIRVLIVDDHAVVRGGLQAFLELQDGIEVAGEAEDGQEAVAMAQDLHPDVILMDLVMPRLDGVAAMRALRESVPKARVVVLTSFLDDEKLLPALRAGAAGYLLKNAEPQELARAVRAAHADARRPRAREARRHRPHSSGRSRRPRGTRRIEVVGPITAGGRDPCLGHAELEEESELMTQARSRQMGSPAEETSLPARASGTFAIGGELSVHRLGFGAMRLPGVWGEPAALGAAHEVLREAVRLGVDLIDTAQAYGPEVSERLIAEALHPYPEGLVIATKGGLGAGGDPDGRPDHLRADCEGSLRRLRLDTIDLWQLHRIDPAISVEEQFGVIRELRDEGKIRFVGISEVSLDELRRARELVDIATVQNRFNYLNQTADDVLRVCGADQIGFIPWHPLAKGELAQSSSPLAAVADRHGVTPAQLALAWLLQRSPVILPIPGTGSSEHLRENVDAALIELSGSDLLALERDALRSS